MSDNEKIALVTGGNRGIGREICRQLASKGMTVILTARDAAKGEQVTTQLRTDNPAFKVRFHQLDVRDPDSVAAVQSFVENAYGHLDILINNAGVFPDAAGPSDNYASVFDAKVETLQAGMDANLYGPLLMCQAFIPMMINRNYGRVVNISTGMAQLSEMNGGYPSYRTSKTALNALTCIFADELKNKGVNVLINSACPGWVRTEMGGANANRDVKQGAEGIVGLATLSDGGPSGGFFRDLKPLAW